MRAVIFPDRPTDSFLNLMNLKPHNRTAQIIREQNGEGEPEKLTDFG